MELLKIENENFLLTEQAKDLLRQAHKLEVLQKEIEERYKAFKEAMCGAMELYGVTKAQFDLGEGKVCKVTYKAPSTRQQVDSQKLKDEGLYDAFTKTLNVSSSVIVKWGNDGDN